MGTDGIVLDPGSFTIRSGGMYLWATNPDVAFNGTDYLVVWREQDDTAHQWVYVRGVSPSGEVLDMHTLSYPDYPSSPSSRRGTRRHSSPGVPAAVWTPTWSTTVALRSGARSCWQRLGPRRTSPSTGRTTSSRGRTGTSSGGVSPRTARCSTGPQSRSQPPRVVRQRPAQHSTGRASSSRGRTPAPGTRASSVLASPLTEACWTAAGSRSRRARRTRWPQPPQPGRPDV